VHDLDAIVVVCQQPEALSRVEAVSLAACGGWLCRYYGGARMMASCHVTTGDQLVTMKDEVAALARLIRYSEEEALRLGVSGVVVECLRMAGIELTNTIDDGGLVESQESAKIVRMN
jgi:hypothetical protein